MAETGGTDDDEVDPHTWLVDSKATVHVMNSEAHFQDTDKSSATVVMGNNHKAKASFSGTLYLQDKASQKLLRLDRVLYVPAF